VPVVLEARHVFQLFKPPTPSLSFNDCVDDTLELLSLPSCRLSRSVDQSVHDIERAFDIVSIAKKTSLSRTESPYTESPQTESADEQDVHDKALSSPVTESASSPTSDDDEQAVAHVSTVESVQAQVCRNI
jgi:hypothetical protein